MTHEETILNSKKLKKIEKFLKTAQDDEVLAALYLFFSTRANMACQYIQKDDGVVYDYVLSIGIDDKIIQSDPISLDWPLQPLPMPEAFKKKAN